MRKDNTNSLYSIILSTYQSDLYLNAALESLYNQSYQNFELVLINDNSNDNTEKILDYWKNKFNNFVYIKNKENLGLTKSLNIGIYKSKGKFIVRHDSDDISHPSRLAIQDLFLKAYPKINLLFAKEIRINKMGEVIKVSFIKKIIRKIKRLIIFRDLWLYNSVSHGVVSFQRENKGKLILYDESYKKSQDFELWSRLILLKKFQARFILIPLYFLRIHKKSISYTNKDEQNYFRKIIFQRNLNILLLRLKKLLIKYFCHKKSK